MRPTPRIDLDTILRIAFTVHKLPPESLGGTEIYTRSLARTLVAQGHDVVIFAPSTNIQEVTRRSEADGVRLHLVPMPASRQGENPAAQFWHTFRDRVFEAEFTRFLALEQPEVVHFQHVQGVSARMIALARGLPRVATLHDYWYFCANSQLVRPDHSVCSGPSVGCRNCVDCATARADLGALRVLRPVVALPLAWRNRVLSALADEIDLFIAPSAFLRSQYMGQGFDGQRIVVMENGMDGTRLDAGTPSREIIRDVADRQESATRPLRFGFLGTLAWQKGVHVLVDAFNQLLSGRATLDIYGSGSAFPEYATRLQQSVRNPAISLHPPVAYDDVGGVLANFDALIVPSLWFENSPLVIQEAYALGVPVIASRLGALTEKVVEGGTGRLFAAGDAGDLARVLREIIEQPQQLDALRAGIQPPVTMEAHARELVLRYEMLIEQNQSTPIAAVI